MTEKSGKREKTQEGGKQTKNEDVLIYSGGVFETLLDGNADNRAACTTSEDLCVIVTLRVNVC